jgi:cellulose synthase/poly-beta-1,6-N-acetylglucosamine synthase-like glycosyltransferase
VTTSVILTVRDEPQSRVDRLLAALEAQRGTSAVEVVVSMPPEDRHRLSLPDAVAVVDNPGGNRSHGLNRAAAAATGDVVCRLDARSLPPPDYLARCAVRLADDARVGVVGGVQRPVAVDQSSRARGIARAMANPWALGAPAYRREGLAGPVDTVYLGAFRRQELLNVGGFDERLAANEDFELCQRYRRRGQLVWLEAGLVVDYEARATLAELWRQYEAFGRSKVRYWRMTGDRPNARQAAALVGGAGLLSGGIAVRNPRRLAAAAAAATAAVLTLDHLAGPDGDGWSRVSTAAYAAIAGAWLAGVAREGAAGEVR